MRNHVSVHQEIEPFRFLWAATVTLIVQKWDFKKQNRMVDLFSTFYKVHIYFKFNDKILALNSLLIWTGSFKKCLAQKVGTL